MDSEQLKTRWSDIVEESEEENKKHEFMESVRDGSMTKIVVDFKVNEKGQKIKIVKKVRVSKVTMKINKRIEVRKHWKKFGDCSNLPPGPEPGVTMIGEEIFFEQKGKEDQKKELSAGQTIVVTCRNCGKEHWTAKCPYKDKIVEINPIKEISSKLTNEAPKLYRPPIGGRGKDESGRIVRDESATIRVTNLSEDTKESDIGDLFRVFGPIQRIYLAIDKVTGFSKGFAFVSFVNRKDAAKAIEKLSGYGYDHLILRVEWAKPSTTK
jgi:translation initiation factor 3 subunit G